MGTQDKAFDYDWLVIGSGFGGSVSALRLAEKGYRVGVLEAGRRYRDEDYAEDDLGPGALPVGAGARPARHLPAHAVQGRLHRQRLRPSAAAASSMPTRCIAPSPEFFANPQWAGTRTTGRAVLAPHYDTAEQMLGVQTVPHESDGQKMLQEVGEHFGVEDTFTPHAGRRVLRQARRDRARSVLRRRGPGAHRLHALRRVHGGLPRGRQEHAGQELSLVRREAGRRDPAEREVVDIRADRVPTMARRLPGHDASVPAPGSRKRRRDVHGARHRDVAPARWAPIACWPSASTTGSLPRHQRPARANWCAPTASRSSP